MDPSIEIVSLDDQPGPLSDTERVRVERALDTMPELHFAIFWMMMVERLGIRRTGRRLIMSRWSVRRHLIAAIAHIDRVVNFEPDPGG